MDLCNINDIKSLLNRHGFRFSKSMGQNFLVDAGVPLRIAEESGIDGSFGVLEIGPGIGPLTVRLAEKAAKVVAVELDRSLFPILSETLGGADNAEIVGGDVLKLDLEELLKERFKGLKYAVCANLPYNITTPVLTKLIDTGLFETITVMVQREVARRICAKAGTADYGAFTVYCNVHTEPETLFDISPDSFMPAPKVWSSVVKMKKRPARMGEIKDEAMFFRVVKASFAQRRKTLVNCLESAFSSKLNKEELVQIVSGCGFDPKVRGETLDIGGFAAVAAAVGERLK
jgi:16S rRNA (adenine1518-N6/adenine1519-N6)-dimethyltransferase